jgi:antitoxin ParD1/3/4
VLPRLTKFDNPITFWAERMERGMATMNVSLPREFVEFVNREVESGEYVSASEVVRDALRLLRREKAAEEEKLAILRREVAVGLADVRAGRLSRRTATEIAADLAAADDQQPG